MSSNQSEPRLSLAEFKRLFSEVLTLTDTADAITGSYEGATLRIVKGKSDAVPTAELVTPPTEGEHASRYGLFLSLFFFGVLREQAKADLATWMKHAANSAQRNGEFAQVCAGVLIRIYYDASSERVHVIAEVLPE